MLPHLQQTFSYGGLAIRDAYFRLPLELEFWIQIPQGTWVYAYISCFSVIFCSRKPCNGTISHSSKLIIQKIFRKPKSQEPDRIGP